MSLSLSICVCMLSFPVSLPPHHPLPSLSVSLSACLSMSVSLFLCVFLLASLSVSVCVSISLLLLVSFVLLAFQIAVLSCGMFTLNRHFPFSQFPALSFLPLSPPLPHLLIFFPLYPSSSASSLPSSSSFYSSGLLSFSFSSCVPLLLSPLFPPLSQHHVVAQPEQKVLALSISPHPVHSFCPALIVFEWPRRTVDLAIALRQT